MVEIPGGLAPGAKMWERAQVLLPEKTPSGRAYLIVVLNADGFARATQIYGPLGVPVVRNPFDFSFAVSRLLDRVKPDAFVAMELEVWPHITMECLARKIPFIVANGRLSERSFKGYARARALVSPMFVRIACALVQNEAYAARFRALGTREVKVLDTMKWDTAVIEDAAQVSGASELAEAMGIDRSKPLIVAGSTGPGEEKMLMASLPAGVQLLLAPRKPERFEEVANLCPAGTPRRSLKQEETSSGPVGPRSQVFLLDTLGELRKAYALADVCLVGRSFLGLYGSDPFEPVGLGKPTIIGPHHGDFKDAVDALAGAGGLKVSAQPMKEAAQLLANPRDAGAMAQKGVTVIRSRQGVSKKYAERIVAML
jgi:3-deoxy-D-manno-octulosonic-acid transferase